MEDIWPQADAETHPVVYDRPMKYQYTDLFDPNVPVFHQLAVFMRLQGMTNKSIAKELGRGLDTISKILNHPPNVHWIEQQQQELLTSRYKACLELQRCHKAAADKLVNLMDSKDDRVSLSAIRLLFERTGLGVPPARDESGDVDGETYGEDVRDIEAIEASVKGAVDG